MHRRLLSGDGGIALLLGTLGLFWMVAAFNYGFWEGFAPRPGFLPFCYGLLLFVLAAVILIQSTRSPDSNPDRSGDRPMKPFLVMLVIGATLLGLNVVGFVAAAFIALVVMFVLIERKPIVRSLIVASTTVATFHLLLAVWLRVPLPVGPFGI